jgi:hypothetical protein
MRVCAHLHLGGAGVNGPVVIPLAETSTGSGTWAAPSATTIPIDLRLALASGSLYANVHSAVFPGGQIRGQVGTEVRTATQTGTQENPPIVTSAKGTAVISVDPSTRALVARITTSGLTGTVAHIHSAAAGANGPVANTQPTGHDYN